MIIDPRKIIINRRGLRSRSDVLLSVFLPLAFVAALAYLARPLTVMIGWSAAALTIDSAMASGDQLESLPSFLAAYFPVIGGLSAALSLWACYNRLRYGGVRDLRRADPPTVSLEEIASRCPLGIEAIRRIRRAEISFFFFDGVGAVIGIKCGKAEIDADYVLAQASALAPAVAAGLVPPKIPDAVRPIPPAPRARALRPVPSGAYAPGPLVRLRPVPVIKRMGGHPPPG